MKEGKRLRRASAPLQAGLGGVHRIRFQKQKQKIKRKKIYLFFLLSLSDLWIDVWIQFASPEIAQQYQCYVADKPSASAH